MTLIEMQILFYQIVEDTSSIYVDSQRPDSYNVVNYLNQSVMRYIQKKYLSFPTIEENINSISKSQNDLKDLIRRITLTDAVSSSYHILRNGLNPIENTPTQQPYGSYYKIYQLPYDFMHVIACSVQASRTNASIMKSNNLQWTQCKIVPPNQSKRFITNSINLPILRESVVFFNADQTMVLIYDHEQGEPNDVELTYLIKPYKLSFDFNWITGFVSSMIGQYFRVKAGSRIMYPTSGFPAGGWYSGQQLKVRDGYETIYPYTDDMTYESYVGYPANETDECPLAVYLHEDIVRLAVQMFLEEAKLKLVTKVQA